jgi:hypothetical protein
VNSARWLWLAVALAGIASAGPEGSSKEFVLELPPGIETAHRVVLELREVRLPRNKAAVFRARAIEEGGAEVPLGSVGMLAESGDAEGTALHGALRIEVTSALKRWRHAHPDAGTLRIRVAPYAGKEPLADLEWSTETASLKIVTP